MARVVIHGWEKGLKTISLMHVLVSETGVSMQEAKRSVEGLLAGQAIEFDIEAASPSKVLSDELSDIGAIWRIDG